MQIAKTQIVKTMTRKSLPDGIVIDHDHEIGAEIGATEMTTSVTVAETETAGGTGVAIAADGAATAAAPHQ